MKPSGSATPRPARSVAAGPKLAPADLPSMGHAIPNSSKPAGSDDARPVKSLAKELTAADPAVYPVESTLYSSSESYPPDGRSMNRISVNENVLNV